MVGGKIEGGRREGPRSEVVLEGGEMTVPTCDSSKIGTDEMYVAS